METKLLISYQTRIKIVSARITDQPIKNFEERVLEYSSQCKMIAHGKIKVQIIHTKQRKTDRESYLSYIPAN